MNDDSRDQVLEGQLRKTLGSAGKADFESWINRHGDSLACLNPVVTERSRFRRRMVMRAASATAAAVIFLGILCWILVPERASFAEAIRAINEAKTITWTETSYTRFHGKDGKRTWLETSQTKYAYRHPGLYRTTFFDEAGNVREVEIRDSRSGKTLWLDMRRKSCSHASPIQSMYAPQNPFGWVAEFLETEPLESIGRRTVDGKTVNVFRYRPSRKGRDSFDIWIDVRTKRPVRFYTPAADDFDPATMTDRDNPAENTWSKSEHLGILRDNMVFDSPLDVELFSLAVPEGFELVQAPPRQPVTEADLVEWLRATARVNSDTFVDTAQAADDEQLWDVMRKDIADRTDVETKLADIWSKHSKNRNFPPVLNFRQDNTVGDSFRYLGKRVKLGSADRIVCWYKLKSTGKYRAVFGDLTVKDVEPKDLPLPIDQ